jgi:hypothetical protein
VTSAIALGCATSGETDGATPGLPVDYARQVEPILEASCYKCHGPVQVPSGKLRLDSRDGMLTGGRSGHPSVIPRNATDSPLYIVITGGSGDGTWRAMPPHGKRLKAREIGTLRRWIDQGASFGPE